MPELPDVEVYRRYFNRTALHKSIKDIEVKSSDLLERISKKNFISSLKKSRFIRTKRHGKYLFVDLGKNRWLSLHFGMTGELKYFKEGNETPKYSKVLFFLDNGYILSYISRRKLGKIELIDVKPSDFVRDKGLGPDALSVSYKKFGKRIGRSKGKIKSALMNQKLLSGIGNIYSDEILFKSRLNPARDVSGLEKRDLKRIHRNSTKVLKKAIEKKADPEKLPSSYLIPHREKGAHCPFCGGKISKKKISGRPSYFCPKCQKNRRT